ncbi:MAG: iron ABC transporter permease [Spirochaetaceae bacterium]|jgi:iron complex transport system permease protein|nr:iron ABC transporter permease [Spirochaetaceae bacterium]
MVKSEGKHNKNLLFLLFLLIVIFFSALLLGRYPSTGFLNPKILFTDPLARKLVLNLRLPRILTSLMLGMTLAGSGMVFQMIFSNPLVEPGFLGVSQGAAFGAAFAIVFFGSSLWIIQGSAAFFAVTGLAFSYFIAKKIHFGGWVLRLILSGIAVSAIYSAGIGIMKYTADPMSQLPEITFWLLGGLWSISWREFLLIFPISSVAMMIIYLMRWKLNILSLEDETAFSLGISPVKYRMIFLISATVATAALIAVSGIINWVGLIVPHIARRLFRSDTSQSLPAAMLMGAIFTIFCDTLARILFAGEIPLGIITSLFGAGLFILLLLNRNIKVQR